MTTRTVGAYLTCVAAAAISTESAPAPRKVGRPFEPGKSGNPTGRPKGIAQAARDGINNDPHRLLNVFLEIAEDTDAKHSDRVSAAREYLDRAYGKAPAYAPVEGDPLNLDVIDSRITAVLDDLAVRREAQAAERGSPSTVEATGTSGAAAA